MLSLLLKSESLNIILIYLIIIILLKLNNIKYIKI